MLTRRFREHYWVRSKFFSYTCIFLLSKLSRNWMRGCQYYCVQGRLLFTWLVLSQMYKSNRTLMDSPSALTVGIPSYLVTTNGLTDQRYYYDCHIVSDANYSNHIHLAFGNWVWPLDFCHPRKSFQLQHLPPSCSSNHISQEIPDMMVLLSAE
jgi:hypothetical protein